MSRYRDDTQEQAATTPEVAGSTYLQSLSETDFRAMLVFVAVVELNGIRQAARALGCSEPSVSMALGRFRDSCRQPLFNREGRKLEPTAEAVSLARELGTCFFLMNRAAENTRGN